MKWERGHQSKNVEDRRGTRARGTGVKVGAGAAIVAGLIALIGAALGVDLSSLSGGGGGGGGGGGTPAESTTVEGGGIPADKDPDRELYEYSSYVLDDIQLTFAKKFREGGKTYRDARLVVFSQDVDTQCGTGEAAIGPFYCPPDEKAYIDLSFYRVLKDRLGAGGDFAQAYVLAHEIGHHLQTLLGTDLEVHRKKERDPSRASDLSVRQELQADCYAGVWASSTAERGLLERGDIDESVAAAASIGDDRLQKMAGEKVNSETWTHGSSAQRVKWFQRGLDRGSLDACDTFSGTP